MKKLFILLMAFCLCFSLVACGGAEADDKNDETTADSAVDSTKPVDDTTEPVDDGKVIYTVKVVDEEGNAIVGAAVQLCKDTCLPGFTDESGVATFNVIEDDYKVSFMMLPEGYTYTSSETEFYFEDGSYEITLTLKAL